MTKNEKALKKIEQDLNSHGLEYELGEMGRTIWTNNCTIEIGYDGNGVVTVNEKKTELEDVIWEVLAVERPDKA